MLLPTAMPDTKSSLTITPSLAHLAEELRPMGISLNDLLRLALWCRPTAETVAHTCPRRI